MERAYIHLFSETLYFVRCKNRAIVLFLLSFILISCDSTDNVPVQHVDSSDRLSDLELQLKQKQKQPNTYYFGFDLRASPQEDAAQYLPFLSYLEDATGYHFKIHFTPKSSTSADDLGLNKTQFSAMGATSYLYAQSRYGAISIARGLNKQGKAEYQSVFVVKPKSPVRSIKDIAGKKLAFGSRNSTQGHLIPRIMLTENGISLTDLNSYSYTGSHQNCAEAVVSDNYDVCGMQDQLAKNLVAEGLLEIIHSSRYYPSSGIVVNKSVPVDVVARVKQALLDFDPQGKHSHGLYHWDKTEMPSGFVTTRKSDYLELRQWLIRLGFLQKNNSLEKTQ